MRAHHFTGICLVATAVGAALVSCTDIDCHGGVACTGPGDAGVADSNTNPQQDSGPIIPEGCDPTADAKDAPKCVDDVLGVFVDATNGSDSNPGTKEAPTKTIGAALTKLDNKSRVYVCGEGPYAEAVHITSTLSIFGGFECSSWHYDGSKAKISPNEPGIALEVRNLSAPIVLSDIAVTAKDASSPGATSIAAFLSSTDKVTFRRAALSSGKGADGVTPTTLSDFSPANADKGNDGTSGGAEKKNVACPSSIGGRGGNATEADGADGKRPINPPYPAAIFSGSGGTTGGLDCNTNGLGKSGSFGGGGASGAGATKLGELTSDGWMPDNGASGGNGIDGQGGGGGAHINPGGIGGSGGPGGCGGAGGSGGGGGGASIALLAFESPVSLEESSLSTSDAGNGGNGARGQKAQLGGLKGTGINSSTDSCDGGPGGHGGSGGGGGGGAGGVSVGVLFKGTPPVIDGISTPSTDTLPSISIGAAGVAGNKGLGGESARSTTPASNPGADGSNGISGVAKAVLAIP